MARRPAGGRVVPVVRRANWGSTRIRRRARAGYRIHADPISARTVTRHAAYLAATASGPPAWKNENGID